MLSHKLSTLHKILQPLSSALVALSGGVDSSVLATLTHDILGDNMEAVYVDSPCFDPRDKVFAQQIATEAGIRLNILTIDPLHESSIRTNPPDRCYLCKNLIFSAIQELAHERNLAYVLEGSNVDDQTDYRPGLEAIREKGILSPLMESGMTKGNIRRIAHDRKLPVADRPSQACYMTRFPFGQLITMERIIQIREAEDFLKILGYDICRVRAHGTLARIEVPAERGANLFQQHRAQIVTTFRELGFQHIALDLEGFISGSMNRTIEHKPTPKG